MPSLSMKVLLDNNLEQDTFRFYPGEDVELRVQIREESTEQHYLLPEYPIPTLTFHLPGNPTNLSIASDSISIDSRDRSIVSTIISDVNTLLLTTGNIRLVIDEAAPSGNPDLTALDVVNSAVLTVDGTPYAFTTDGLSNGTFQVGSVSGLSRGMLGTVSDSNTAAVSVVIVGITPIGAEFLLQVETYTVNTRMAQIKNAVKRLNINPT